MLKELEDVKEILKEKYNISKTISPRCYLFPDGDVLQLDLYTSHKDVDWFLERKGVFESSNESKNHGGCLYLENLGCIRVNLETEGFVGLSPINPTSIQYKVLEDMFYMYCNRRYAENHWHRGRYEIYPNFQIFTPRKKGFESRIYNLENYQDSLDDFITIIKNYYSSGKLLENLDDLR